MSSTEQIVYLSQAQYAELLANQTITVDGVTVTYSENDIYVTPQDVQIADVRINGTTITDTYGIADIPLASTSAPGAVTLGTGLRSVSDKVVLDPPTTALVKSATSDSRAVTLNQQHTAAFYGFAKAAGDTTQSASSNSVGTYTETAKSKISEMLCAPETISGTSVTITAKAGIQYSCGELTSLTFTPSSTGICDVIFSSGSTPTVLVVPNTVLWPDGFDPTSLETNRVYELNILNGIYGEVMSWKTT